MKSPRILTPLVLFLLLAGCATVGRKLDPAKVAGLKQGQTREQVLALVGSPDLMTRTALGETTFSYTYVHAAAKAQSFIPLVGAFVGGTDVQQQHLTVVFGDDGLVKNFTTIYAATDLNMGASAGGKAKLDEVEQGKRPR